MPSRERNSHETLRTNRPRRQGTAEDAGVTKPVKKRGHPRALLDLVAADKQERKTLGRHSVHLTTDEVAILQRYAVAVKRGRYANAVLAVDDCRAALEQLRRSTGSQTPPRTRQALHRQLFLRARALGRPRIRVRWHDAERKVLDRFARAVARGTILTARGAGEACLEALNRLHRRYPEEYADVHQRSIYTIQHKLWPRVAKLRYRWFNSQWSKEEEAIAHKYAAAVIAHRYPTVRAAAKVCQRAVNRLHAKREHRGQRGRLKIVRTLSATFDKVFEHTREMDTRQLPHRRWTAEESKVAARWMHVFDQYMRGRSRANLFTAAEMLRAELGRIGYYRTFGACVTQIVTQRGRMLGRPGRYLKLPARPC